MLLGNSTNILKFNITTRQYDLSKPITISDALSMEEVKNEILVSNFNNIIYRIDKSTWTIKA